MGYQARVAPGVVLLPLLLVGTPSLAQVNECQEVFSECREDCSIEHSSMKGNAPTKLNKCIKKCQKKLTACEEREVETKNNALEAGSLDKTPTSRDVDESGLPTRTSGKKSSSDDEVRRPSPGDVARELDGSLLLVATNGHEAPTAALGAALRVEVGLALVS